MSAENNPPRNVLGGPLEPCCFAPRTGYFRDGFCRTDAHDHGSHTVCAEMTEEFLEFTRSRGNDLSTPHPAFGFPGLRPGDRWCLCASRWREAYEAGCAPSVVLEACHERALTIVSIEALQELSIGGRN
jgi:uncharacterized protein (DUF2237 family)